MRNSESGRHDASATGGPLVECLSIHGGSVWLPRDKLIFRPGAYAVVLHKGQVLVVSTRTSGKLFFPGGGIELGERVEDALRREVKEETGIEIEVQRLLHFEEDLFYYDPLDEASHSLLLFFLCAAKTLTLAADTRIEDKEAECPRWVDLASLNPDDFQPVAQHLVSRLRNGLASR